MNFFGLLGGGLVDPNILCNGFQYLTHCCLEKLSVYHEIYSNLWYIPENFQCSFRPWTISQIQSQSC